MYTQKKGASAREIEQKCNYQRKDTFNMSC